MTSKLALFKARCQSRGQSLLLARRSAETPGAAYEDPYLGGADPASEDYPASRVLPAYEAAFEVRAFVQPARAGLQSGAAGLVVMAPWGKEVQVVKTAYVPGDTTIGLLDRATFDGDDYIVVALSPNYAADELVMVEAQLAPAMPGMG